MEVRIAGIGDGTSVITGDEEPFEVVAQQHVNALNFTAGEVTGRDEHIGHQNRDQVQEEAGATSDGNGDAIPDGHGSNRDAINIDTSITFEDHPNLST